jgi:hypothetical protein
MTDALDDAELMSLAAADAGVPAEILGQLLELEDSFQSFSVFGAKAEFSRQVTKILDEGSNKVSM